MVVDEAPAERHQGHTHGGLEEEHHRAVDHQDGGQRLRVPQEAGEKYAEKAAGGD